ncbi:TolC family protein [Paraburkholderia sp. SARCC-3016]|uniref:TolC family protein n=1 Tax=Paraburkholderia sp. SARCC-3016 TaxID=3058611 RepID=UPI002807A861|nr:TolC family protein [Paraburkholderia sp. SARCC-3016]MDQ7980557.1 TolC family protein [Paraburkholderia sp. SARCC-3016]
MLLLVALTGACALAPPPQHDDVVRNALPAGTTLPPAWKSEASAVPVADDWLKQLGDPMLDAVVSEAIANNLDLRQAADLVAIAQQAVVVAGAQLWPQIGATGGGRTTHDFDHDNGSTTSVVFGSVAWEIDVWGKLRAKRAAAQAGYEATALDYAYARQSLAATVAQAWYLTIEAKQLLALAEHSVDIYGQLLDLVSTRRTAGKDSDLDVADTRAKLESALSSVEAARQSYADARRALEVLLGRYPATEIEVAATYPLLPAPPAAGLPAALLERRPDLIAAERQVLAAFRQEEVAKLALLPDFSFTFAGGRLGDPLFSLLNLNPWLVTAAIGASIPIFTGGALQAQIRIATAQQAQAVAHYGSVVLVAFREVEDSLANERFLTRRLPLEQNAVDSRTEAVRIATMQYKAGRRDLLWVSNLQTAELASQADLIKLWGLQRRNRIHLYLALGGSFDATPSSALLPDTDEASAGTR